MVRPNRRPLNRLEQELPEGVLVDAAWFKKRGYSRQLLSHYVRAGWLTQPTRGVYCRPRGSLSWQQVVISLQALLGYPLLVGGRTALELQGHAHYLPHEQTEVHLYGPKPPPTWLNKLRLKTRFVYHNDRKLFRSALPMKGLTQLEGGKKPDSDGGAGSWTIQSWRQWNWPLALSTPERAVLELLDELPTRESFHQAHVLMQSLFNLSPRRLQKLLADCRSVKVKRLFFFFADRHNHAWLKRLDTKTIDLGKGKRMLVKGGKLDKTYQITVPKDFDGVR
ncbi:type IV toxin-antitoxin system AbiEi family antitoxin domain-containing protein [Bradyrhizobium sp. CCGUVB23]|uniref:type IV toxin-antitoxin system AbiEi family antitoxin domain-containing protein n=1 Tax=Bradyrhizobium sp. CCGUVB23 TaxID=2949630 RepID=UPI0020B3A9CC|nr:type IV toxin-antitoxin system AbiEi family antitoxin domain-containing protein [Bradyrhizobium sp. CCGUVB23]MCP3460361.1 type IV toxin-antitoxin system AbiEi family antitoxin [Bradyrhizobium sp. CCGUVB23]